MNLPDEYTAAVARIVELEEENKRLQTEVDARSEWETDDVAGALTIRMLRRQLADLKQSASDYHTDMIRARDELELTRNRLATAEQELSDLRHAPRS